MTRLARLGDMQSHSRSIADAGMTLIEVLVVLAIIAITAGVSVLAIGTGGSVTGRAEAARLASRVQLASDRAMIEDDELALVPAADGYAFVQWDAAEGSWKPSRFARLDERYRLPAGMTLTSADQQAILPLGTDTGGRGFVLTLAAKGRTWMVDFDGVTARVKPNRPAAVPRGG